MAEYVSPEDEIVAQLAMRRAYVTESQIADCLKAQVLLWSQGMRKDLLQVILDKGFMTSIQADEVRHAFATKGKAKLLAGFEIQDLIGRGAMGKVYKALQISLDRTVALKILPSRLARDEEYVARFYQEAKAAARLNHPNVVHCYEVGKARGYYFMAMEFVEGENIAERMKRDAKLPEKEALGICLQIARALRHAHENGIVHRDIKPDNILYMPEKTPAGLGGVCGLAKLSDLGLAKRLHEDVHLTQSGAAVGTPLYISPEQAAGEPDVDIRADIYSLGATLYHMLVGEPPYKGTSAAVILTHHLNSPVPEPKEKNPQISDKTASLIRRAMAKSPEKRQQTPADMIHDFELALGLAQAEAPKGETVSEMALEEEEMEIPSDVLDMLPPKPAPAKPQPHVGSSTAVAPPPPPSFLSRVPWNTVAGVVMVAICALVILFIVRSLSGGPGRPKPRAGGKTRPGPTAPKPKPGPSRPKPVLYPPKPRDPAPKEKPKPVVGLTAEEAARLQQTTAAELGIEHTITDSAGVEFKLIPPGKFVMGSAEGERQERPPHEVKITRAFFLSTCEITQKQFTDVMGKNPSEFKGPGLPVDSATWGEAQSFCAALSEKGGAVYRLPTEAEWEYACRAGSTTPYYYGSSEFQLSDYSCYAKVALGRSRPVGQKKPNAWGLLDMHGNMWEWCSDWYDALYYRGSPDVDPAGPGRGTRRVAKGGSWFNNAALCRSAVRTPYDPNTRSNRVGFRVVREIPTEQAP